MSGQAGPIGMGVIGYGRAVVQMHAPEIRAWGDKFKIVAVCVRSKERQEQARATYHCATYGDFRNLLKDPNVELVNIATPSSDHAAMAIAALDAGKNVVLEKPIAVSYVEAQAVQQAANRSAGKLFIRHNRRFFGDFVHVKEIMDSGILGEVFLIRVRCLKYDLRNDWQTLKRCGGGIMLNMGPHFIDHCLIFLGWKYESVWADLKLVAATGDAEDHAKVIFKGDKGLVVDLEISGGAALDEVSYAVYGKHGALACDGKMIHLKYYDPRKVVRNPAHAETPGMDAPFGSSIGIPWIEAMISVKPPVHEIWNEVYKAIREGGEYPITVEEAVRVMKTICEVKGMAGF